MVAVGTADGSVVVVVPDCCGGAFIGRDTGTPISTVNGAFVLLAVALDGAAPFVIVVVVLLLLLFAAAAV